MTSSGRRVTCEAHYAPSLDDECSVAFAVPLESAPGAVRLVAVGLDDQPLFGPEKIGLDMTEGGC